jgi:pyruvate ferredoxin oxidoreductase gamma subunit/2-oxoisovalerate ferredoxin oxidoreductase gamma subunit
MDLYQVWDDRRCSNHETLAWSSNAGAPLRNGTIMLEIRFHGRGGQGTVVASILLAKAFFQAGYQVQSFPLFGVERRGAPVEAYLRLNQNKILARTNVYTPDHVVVLDRTLLHGVNVTRGAKPGGWVLINSPPTLEFSQTFPGLRLALIDATRIALAHGLGTRTHPIVNTAMVGAFARVLAMPPMDTVAAAIREDVPSKPDDNIQAALDAYQQVQLIGLAK